MKAILNHLFAVIAILVCTQLAQAAITATQVIPGQRQLLGSQDTTLAVTWQVAVAPPTTSVMSSAALVINPTNGSVLTTLGSPFNGSGPGPYSFSETYTFSAAQVQDWLSQGLRRLVISRTFTSGYTGSDATESLLLTLNSGKLSAGRSGAGGELVISGLRLDVDSGNNLALVKKQQALSPRLSVYYSGSGLLEGRWQVAEPAASSDKPVFHTLALVRRQLTAAQRTEIDGPVLPTHRSGRYLLRFCVSNRALIDDASTASGDCPIQALIVEGAYQVGADTESGAQTQAAGGL